MGRKLKKSFLLLLTPFSNYRQCFVMFLLASFLSYLTYFIRVRNKCIHSFIHQRSKTALQHFLLFLTLTGPRLPSTDCSKTFRVSLGSEPPPKTGQRLHPLFIPIGAVPFQHIATAQSLIRPSAPSSWREPAFRPLLSTLLTRSRVLFLYVGYYVLVYLQGFFLHCVNSRQQEMLCHSLFLSGGQRRLFCVVVAVQTGSELCVLSIRSIFLFLSGFITCKFHSNDIFLLTVNAPEMRKVNFFYFLVSSALLHFF